MFHKIIIYGAGKRCQKLCEKISSSVFEVAAIIDSNPERWGKEVEGYPIAPPEKVKDFQEAFLCISIADSDEDRKIKKQIIQKYNFQQEMILSYYECILLLYKADDTIKEYIIKQAGKLKKENRILFECQNGLGLGGVEAWTKDICIGLIKAGENNVSIISDDGVYDIPPILKEHIIYTNINHIERFTKDSILKMITLLVKELPCKVVVSFPHDLLVAAYLIKCCYPDLIEVVSVFHVGDENFYQEFWDFRECSDMYVCVSQDIRNEMIARGLPSEKVYSMTCPFACEKQIERSYTLEESLPIRIGYAGRMDGMEHSQKRMDLILKLIGQLVEDGVCFKIELAGDGPAQPEMERFIRQHHWEDRTSFLGKLERSKLSAFWRRQDVCVNLADFEGRSISVIEAMGNGAIPVVTSTSGISDDVINDVNGYIVPLGDYRAAANRIGYLSKHRERLCEMGRRAHDAVYPKSLMEPHLSFWKEILGLTISEK